MSDYYKQQISRILEVTSEEEPIRLQLRSGIAMTNWMTVTPEQAREIERILKKGEAK